MTEQLTLEKFEEASEIVQKVTLETKLKYSEYFTEQTGNKVWFKPENMQYTGAYKVRGAYYKISTLSQEERDRGLITASAGNHAQGVAYAAKIYGCKAVIVMPTTTPLIKINRGFSLITLQLSGIDSPSIKTLEPITTLFPIVTFPPSMEAFEYIVTLFPIVGCLLMFFISCPFDNDRAPSVTP